MTKKVLILFIAAFVLRLIFLNQSLWLDEATTAKAAQLSFSQIITQFSPTDFHPPLYYLFMKVWTSFFGISEIALRFPSVLFMLIAGWFVYKTGKFIKDESTGFWAAAFFLINPLIIYYSQEARMYGMITCIVSICLYYFLKLLKKPTKESLVIFNIFIALSFLTFYASAYIVASFHLYLLATRRFKVFLQLLPGSVVTLILNAPLLYLQFTNAQQVLTQITNWSLVLGKVTLKNFALIPLKFAVGRISFEPKIVYYLIGGLWTITVLIDAAKGSLKNRTVLYFLITPLIIGLIFSFFTPMLQYFRFIYLIPVLVLLIALGAKNEFTRSLVLSGFIIFSLAYLLLPVHHRENWKAVARTLSEQKEPVYIINSVTDPLLYYDKTIQTRDLRELQSSSRKMIMVIPYAADIYGIQYRDWLTNRGYRLREYPFRGVTIEYWQK